MREYRELRAYYRALADATRLRILGELGRRGQVGVSDLSLALGVTQPLMSWHLRILKRARLVTTQRQGRQVLCSLNRSTAAEFEERLHALLAGAPARAEAPLGGEVVGTHG
jgi:DNA-binding transcriptional ArsR family regulator